MKKYTEARYLCASSLRGLCIRNNWYTKGTNEEYMHLFSLLKVEGLPKVLTTEDLAEIATDIYEHSEVVGIEIPEIMYDLNRACDTIFCET